MPSHIHLRSPSYAAGRRSSRASDALPKFYPYDDKPGRHHPRARTPWTIPFFLVIPGMRRKLYLWLPNAQGLHQISLSRFGRRRGSFLVFLAYLILIFAVFAFAQRFGSRKKTWPGSTTVPTLVYKQEDLQRIWHWEIASGHHPSRRTAPDQLGLEPIGNPTLPPKTPIDPASNGIGPERVYLDVQSQPPNVAYPPRPLPGSIADLDILMRHCDFSTNKYVRDCLEVLRVSAGLDSGKRVRRVVPDDWKYIYVEDKHTIDTTQAAPSIPTQRPNARHRGIVRSEYEAEASGGFTKSRRAAWEPSPIQLPIVKHPRPRYCDSDEPRIFHMFWSGEFTDKPYLAILSFLYTQNLGLHELEHSDDSLICSPKLWLWINPGYIVTSKKPALSRERFEQLKDNKWAAPFLHPRFKNIIQFKFWNTTEQLDSVAELRDEWRSAPTLFNSGGHTIAIPGRPRTWSRNDEAANTAVNDSGDTVVSDSESLEEPEKISVVLSDMARFLLCHRFGGIYLDADTLFLRDWEELWGWKGAFAYRWSWHDNYNTAVLRLNKGSVLGTFLLRTAFKNDFDFHPMTITNYMKEAKMEELLYRLPDAMFDAAWLNMEGYQRERPPQPSFTRFEEFFETPQQDSAAPQVVGFDGFFKGAFSYHFHNSWSRLADPSRNYPDLGPRFPQLNNTFIPNQDQQDLNWSTVLKRTFESYLRGETPNMYGEWIQY